jgi:hypothetical protein
MADIIDGLNLMESFSRFIPALLVLVIVYAVMLSSGKLGKNQFINSMVAFSLAAMVLFNEGISKVINIISPWFVVLFIFVIFILIAVKSTGVTDSMIIEVIKGRNYIVWTIVFIAIGILLYGIGQMLGQDLLTGDKPIVSTQEIVNYESDGTPIYSTTSTATDDFNTNFNNTIFHPAILGLGLIGLIAAFTVFFMTD